ncbi:MAG TPA: hypothetical protein VKT77_07730 [Chthonomonadaceae bacterium]|nr:hypothetical protein [Chthonomonadaceae bacterium]
MARNIAAITWSMGRAVRAGAALAAAAALVCAPAFGQDRRQGASLLTDRDAYLAPPADLIAGPVVERSTISPLGHNVAIVRMGMRIRPENLPSANNPNPARPTMDREIVFWNAEIRRPVSLWRSAEPEVNVTLSEWMPTTESMFAVVDRVVPPVAAQPGPPAHEFRLLLLGNGIERAVPVPLPQVAADMLSISVSPSRPIAVARLESYQPNGAGACVLLHPNGRVGARIDLPQGDACGILWDADGNPVLSDVPRAQPGPRKLYAIDTRTGGLKQLTGPLKEYQRSPPAPPKLPFRIVSSRQNLKMAETALTIGPVWLESVVKSESPRLLICADGSGAVLLPDGSGALYEVQNALWFMPLIKIDKEQYLAMRAAAHRTVLISNAKQLGLAAIMFAEDNDEQLPSPDGIHDKLAPYLGAESLFENFTYTFAGGSMADIQSPSETELGYVAGDDGRAVIYADGHVKWAKK